MRLGAGVIAFEVKGGKKEAQEFLNHLSFLKNCCKLRRCRDHHPASSDNDSRCCPRREPRKDGYI